MKLTRTRNAGHQEYPHRFEETFLTPHPAPALALNPGAPVCAGGVRTFQEAAHRLLQRTAHLLVSTPGGLRFEPGSRPWLVGLPAAARISASVPHHTICA
jgi:hypothetical protein